MSIFEKARKDLGKKKNCDHKKNYGLVTKNIIFVL